MRTSPRLKYILEEYYSISEIESIYVDGENCKVDVNTPDRMLRFKAKGTQSVLVPNPEQDGVRMTMDPALAQGIYNIVDEFGK